MTLFLVASPIGNLGDITQRAIETLREADIIAAEDTRRTGQLLHHFGIHGPRLVALYDPVERQRLRPLIEALEAGQHVALISDAGTPCLSDPGYPLVRSAVEANIPVVPIPGPSAILAALVASGLPADRFTFEGFLPRTASARTACLAALEQRTATTIYFESPHRIAKSVRELAERLPDRPVVVARELTKLHEEFIRGTAREVADELAARERIRGEITLLVAGLASAPSPDDAEIARVVALLTDENLAPATVRRLAARLLGVSKKRIFEVSRDKGP